MHRVTSPAALQTGGVESERRGLQSGRFKLDTFRVALINMKCWFWKSDSLKAFQSELIWFFVILFLFPQYLQLKNL